MISMAPNSDTHLTTGHTAPDWIHIAPVMIGQPVAGLDKDSCCS